MPSRDDLYRQALTDNRRLLHETQALRALLADLRHPHDSLCDARDGGVCWCGADAAAARITAALTRHRPDR